MYKVKNDVCANFPNSDPPKTNPITPETVVTISKKIEILKSVSDLNVKVRTKKNIVKIIRGRNKAFMNTITKPIAKTKAITRANNLFPSFPFAIFFHLNQKSKLTFSNYNTTYKSKTNKRLIMDINHAKGVVFELIIKEVLKKANYRPIPDDNEQIKGGEIRGRGEWHQIDAYGVLDFPQAFNFPIRLLAEAKCHKDRVGLPIVRNMVGVVKDISEWYRTDDVSWDQEILAKRYTDCGAIFSLNGFTKRAQKYAYAQGIFLVSYENNPVLSDIFKNNVEKLIKTINFNKIKKWKSKKLAKILTEFLRTGKLHDYKILINQSEFEKTFSEIENGIESITSVIAIANGLYPIHLLSKEKFPFSLFDKTDVYKAGRIFYRSGGLDDPLFFILKINNTKFYFSFPMELLKKYDDRIKMIEAKKRFFSTIDIPIKTDRGIRRILTLKLDTEWLDSVLDFYKKHYKTVE